MTAKVGDVWYRIVDGRYAPPLDEYEQPIGTGRPYLRTEEYRVIRVTPCGVVLDNGRVVLEHWTKKFACPTIELARVSFLARKRRQLTIHRARVEQAEWAIAEVRRAR